MDLTFQLAIERGFLPCFFFRAFWLIQDVFVHPGPIPIMQYFFRNSIVLGWGTD